MSKYNSILNEPNTGIGEGCGHVGAREARKHATIMRRILEEEILGSPTPGGSDRDPEPPSAAPEPVLAPESDATPTAAPVEYIPDFIQHPDEIYEGLLSLPWQRRQATFGHLVPRDEVWIAPYPYHLGDISPTRPTIEILIEHGLGFCVLTKGGTRALADIDLYRPDRDAFACTLTSLNDAFSKKWERNAALPGDRIAALKAFHDAGIFSWVSLEPTLDIESSLAIVKETHEYVDLYKVGRANYLKELTRTTDWEGYTHRMVDLCRSLEAKTYIKKDLQPFLSAGHFNPLRVPQYHAKKQA